MAYFDDSELIDLIRHGFALDDDTGFCSRVLDRPTRRGKPGGLPLNFGIKDSDSDDEQHSPTFWFDPDSAACPHMSEVIQSTILSKLGDTDKDRLIDCIKQPISSQQINIHPVQDNRPKTSLTSRLFEEMPEVQNAQFEKYAKFEATSSTASKVISIIFPLADRLPDENRPCILDIDCVIAAKISDLIGLACFVYSRNHRNPPLSNPSDYELHLADEDFEVDMELPRIDPNNYVGELHFPILALVRKSDNGLTSKEFFHVIVYFVDGQFYKFELENLDSSLQWLKDKVVEMKKQELTNKQANPYVNRVDEYVLEKADRVRNPPLKLEKPISSADEMQQNESLIVPTPTTPSGRRSPRFDFERAPTPSIVGSVGSNQHRESHGSIQEEYVVDRLHRLKPRISAKLVLHENFLELVPTNFDRPKIFSRPLSQKYLSIEYEWIGTVEVQKSTTQGRRMLKIIWLKNMAERLNRINTFADLSSSRKMSRQSSTVSYNEINWQQFCQAYERAQWKTLQLEAQEEDAWKIGVRLNEIVESRDSIVRNVYLNSSFATLSPMTAAEVAFRPKLSTTTAGPSIPTTPSTPQKPRKTSFVPPFFSRMISRQDTT
uniref:Target of rapamycin complex 2 subunit MAPKAP1 n=1 Tax=Acrobeloides nanus TaxID=290746 RepID=A0A914DV82_9BILA